MFKSEDFFTKMTVTNTGDGDVLVELLVEQGRSSDGVNWEKRNIKITSIKEERNEAVKDVYTTLGALLEKCNNDLFNLQEGEVLDDKTDSNSDTND